MIRSALILCVVLLSAASTSWAQLVGVTFLNNSPDAAMEIADIYITQSGATQKGDDIRYQQASNLPSAFIFGDIETTIAVAPGASTSADAKVVEFTFTPVPDASYMIIISGVGTPASFAANPDGAPIGYTLSVFETPLLSGEPAKIGSMFVHGATDQNRFDVVTSTNERIVSNLGFSTFIDTLIRVDRSVSRFSLTATNNPSEIYGAFDVDLLNYSSDVAVFVLSGFKNPQDNQSTQPLVLLAVLEDGNVIRNELVQGSQVANVQLIHNAADPGAKIVDVWLNGQRAVDEFTFRKATGFLEVPAGQTLTIGIAPATSQTYADTLFTVTLPALRVGRTYHVIAQGVVDSTSFAPNPEGRDISFQLNLVDNALTQSADDTKTAVRVTHGVTDAGALVIRSTRGVDFATGEQYGDVSLNYLSAEPATDTLWVYDSVGGSPIVGFIANFSGTKRATVLMASGFLTPADNRNGDAFALVLIDANGNGTTLPAILPPVVSVEETPESAWTLAPNPAYDEVTVAGATDAVATLQICATDGASWTLAVRNGTSTITIPTRTMATGLYAVRLLDASGRVIGQRTLRIVR